jgi:uncharacterized protein (TIGR03067 family)
VELIWLYVGVALIAAIGAIFLGRMVKDKSAKRRVGAWIAILVGADSDELPSRRSCAMKPHTPLFGTMGILFAVAGIGLLAGSEAKESGIPATDAKEAAIRKEKKNLIGTWKAVSCEAGGEKVPEKILKGEVVRWRITENSVEWTVEKEQMGKDKYSLDPTTKPKRIDLMDKEGRHTPGIYSLDGDTLKVCLNEASKERPKEFASKLNTHLSVWVFKREKR